MCIRAAQKLEELAAKASTSPWKVVNDHELIGIEDGDQHAIAIDFVREDADWIVLFDPSITPIIVQVLREGRLQWATDWRDVAECLERHLVARILDVEVSAPRYRYES
jgi:hypothetical protein